MNLDQNPTLSDLQTLLADADDAAGVHLLWVDRSGDVFLSLVPSDMTPTTFIWEIGHRLQFRCESFPMGGGYVGAVAARDQAHVQSLLAMLQNAWADKAEGYIDA